MFLPFRISNVVLIPYFEIQIDSLLLLLLSSYPPVILREFFSLAVVQTRLGVFLAGAGAAAGTAIIFVNGDDVATNVILSKN